MRCNNCLIFCGKTFSACKQNAGHHNFAQKVAENNSMIEHIVFYLFRMELRGTRISKLMISEQKSKTNYSELFWWIVCAMLQLNGKNPSVSGPTLKSTLGWCMLDLVGSWEKHIFNKHYVAAMVGISREGNVWRWKLNSLVIQDAGMNMNHEIINMSRQRTKHDKYHVVLVKGSILFKKT